MSLATSDLVDAYENVLQSCAIPFRQFGAYPSFHGRVRTLQTFEDNARLKALVSSPGDGHVLVVDGGGSLRTALAGDAIAGLAIEHGWAALVIWGAVRDSVALKQLPISIKALGTNPWKSSKAGAGRVDEPVTFGGATFHAGDWIYGDDDGIVVSRSRLIL